jgi:hypothetical protein
MYNNNNLSGINGGGYSNVGVGESGLQGVEPIVPESIKFKTIKKAIAAKRTPIKIRAEQQTYSSDKNKLCRIILPNTSLYDTRPGYLTFTARLDRTGGTYGRFHTGIFSIFDRLRVLCGSTEIEDIRDWNRIYSILWEILNPSLVTGNIGVLPMGFGTQAQRNALAPQSDYACPLWSGVFGTELLPFNKLKNQVVLELYIADPTTCVETDGTLPIITVSNIVFHMERLELENTFQNHVNSYIDTHGLKLGFHTWERYTQSLTTGAQQNVSISQRSSSMNGMLNIFVKSQDINNTLINDKFITWTSPSLTTAQLLINSYVYPDEPIDCVSTRMFEPYQMYLRYVQKWQLNGIIPIAPPLTNDAFNLDRFIQIDDFEAFPELDDVVNPWNTINNNSNIIKKLVFAGLIPANFQLDSWIEYFRLVCIYTDGSVKVIN